MGLSGRSGYGGGGTPSGGGGAPAVPMFEIDFTAIGTHSESVVGAWPIPGVPSFRYGGASANATQADIDSDGLGADGTTGFISCTFDLADLDSILDLTDGGTYAFLMESDGDVNISTSQSFFVGSGIVSPDPNIPQYAAITRTPSINQVKYFQGRGGTWINDHIDSVNGTSLKVSALGLVINRWNGVGYYQADAVHTPPGQVFPTALGAKMENGMGVSNYTYNANGEPTRVLLRIGSGLHITRFTVWSVDYNLRNP